MLALSPWRLAFLCLGTAMALKACLFEDPGFRVLVPAGTRTSFTPDTFPSAAPQAGTQRPKPSPSEALGLDFATGQPLDVAISGPGYFVLAQEEGAQDLAGLCFTRLGSFTWRPFPAQGDRPAGARLVGASGRLAWGIQWDASGQKPAESHGSSFSLAFNLGGQRPSPIELFAAPSLNLAALRLGADGQVQNEQGGGLFAADGREVRWALVLAQAERPEAMQALGHGLFRPTRESGPFQVGLAGSPPAPGALARPLGEKATLLAGHLEAVDR